MNDKEQIKNLQENLKKIRKAAGWTAEQLGDKIGVSKQAICNIENGRCNLNKTQYIAIRAIIDYEAAIDPEKQNLPQIVDEILSYSDEENRLMSIPDNLLSEEGLKAKGEIKARKVEEQKKTEERMKKISPLVATGCFAGGAIIALSIKWMSDILRDS